MLGIVVTTRFEFNPQHWKVTVRKFHFMLQEIGSDRLT
jgi:hypothetical protein